MYSAVQILDVLKAKGYQGDRQISNINSWLKENGLPENEITFPADGDLPEEKVDLVEIFGKKAISFDRVKGFARANAPAYEDITVIGTYREQAKATYNHKAKAGSNVKHGGTVFANADQAEQFGALMRMGMVSLNPSFKGYKFEAEDREILKKTMGVFPETSGGVLVPQVIAPGLIRLVESYGTARTAATVTPMTNHTLDLSRRTGGITGAWVGESTTATESTPTVDQINLVAKKRMTISKVTSELLNDSAISIADFIATEIAQDFANAEDSAFWLGDGTSTYAGFTGVTYAFRALVEANGGTWGDADGVKAAGIVLAAGNTFAEITLQNVLDLIGRIPRYVWQRGQVKFYGHSQFYWSAVERLGIAGDTNSALLNGVPSYRLRGIPFEFVQVMSGVDANSQVPLVLGDISMGAKFGEVRGSMGISASEHVYWTTDEMGFRGTERVAVKVHDIGNYHATASSRTPGPIAALLMSAS